MAEQVYRTDPDGYVGAMGTGWLRTLIFLSLLFCVHCKMIDLDCALFNPVHCQTLLESDDNTFGTIVLAPELPKAVEIRPFELTCVATCATQLTQGFWDHNSRPRTPWCSRIRQRPPPLQLT